jgi:hypothetical protein
MDTGALQSVIFTVMPPFAPSTIIASIRGSDYASGKHGSAKKTKSAI